MTDFTFDTTPTSLAAIGRNDRERTNTEISLVSFNPHSGQLKIQWAEFERTINLYEGGQTDWLYSIGAENIPALKALASLKDSFNVSNIMSIEIFPSGGNAETRVYKITSPGSGSYDAALTTTVLSNLNTLYDPNATFDASKPVVLYGDRDKNGWGVFLDDALTGGSGADVLMGLLGTDQLVGNGGNDELYGGYGLDKLEGGIGNDALYGEQNNDRLHGGAGADELDGSLGADYLNGGAGRDALTGGLGRDVFDFNPGETSKGAARDVISDYQKGFDKIDLSDIDANSAQSGDQDFNLVAAFTRMAGQLRLKGDLLAGDVNGDGLPDFEISLNGALSVSKSDIVL